MAIPPISRYYITLVFLESFATTYNLVNPYLLLLDFDKVFGSFQVSQFLRDLRLSLTLVNKSLHLQIWRLITTYAFAGPFSMGFIFTMMLLFYTFKACEEFYKQKYPEFVYMLLFNSVMVFVSDFCPLNSLLQVYSWIYGSYMVLMSSFVFSVLYVWCKNEPDKQVSIWGFPVQSGNLPWALLVMSILTGGSPFNDLIGIAAGHTYIFLKMTLPVSHGYNLL